LPEWTWREKHITLTVGYNWNHSHRNEHEQVHVQLKLWSSLRIVKVKSVSDLAHEESVCLTLNW